MEFGLQLGGLYEDIVHSAEWAERNGLSAIALSDHYLGRSPHFDDPKAPTMDAFAVLAGLAGATTKVELVVLVAAVMVRHPAVLLKNADTISSISRGRFVLGLGTGWNSKEHDHFGFGFPPLGRRFEILEEALSYLRAGLDPSGPGYNGSHFELRPGGTSVVGAGVRILVGGTGPSRTPELAGNFADEYNVAQYPLRRSFDSSDPYAEMRSRMDRAREVATAAGRDESRIRMSTSFRPIIGANQEEYQSELSIAANYYRMNELELEAALVRRGIPHGEPGRLHDMLASLKSIGIRRCYVQPIGTHSRDRLDRLFDLITF